MTIYSCSLLVLYGMPIIYAVRIEEEQGISWSTSSETQGQIVRARADKTGEIGASRSPVRAKVYKTGGKHPWEDTFNVLVRLEKKASEACVTAGSITFKHL